MEYTKKLTYQSHHWYNDGLRKAKIRDMSGAIVSLRRSLQYSRENIAARNLLGLVYFGRGEVVEALVEWIISKNLKSHENIANYYIKRVQEMPNELETINQAIRKFNQCLGYCKQNGEDLAVIQLKKVVQAHPAFLKAYQLLSLLYIQTEQYTKARQVLRRAHRLDTTNEITLNYMHELTQVHNQKVAKLKDDQAQTVTYRLGNETIIQPASASLKDNATLLTIINIVIGLAVGAAVVWFLIMPATAESRYSALNRGILEYSEQIETLHAEVRALERALEESRALNSEEELGRIDAERTQESYEAFMLVRYQYDAGIYSDAVMAANLREVDRSTLAESSQTIYDQLALSIFTSRSEALLDLAVQRFNVNNFAGAIEALDEIMAMNERYLEGAAMLLLADSNAQAGNTERANEIYDRIIELFPYTEVASNAERGLAGTVTGTDGL